ncbi:hypothetical protein [uncultured Bradyrhizobium sp.]|uniref:hypothetical protein n=1 Tax=uncultured Bradyrhizobium sp. TaxID=199684 RepID=UPI0035CC4AE0
MGILSQYAPDWKGGHKPAPARLKSGVAPEAKVHVRTIKSKPDLKGDEHRNWRFTKVLFKRLRELSASAFRRTSSKRLVQSSRGKVYELKVTEEVVAAMRAREERFND